MNDASGLRLLVLGGTGMLGHKVWQLFRERADTWVTVRSTHPPRIARLFDPARTITEVRANDFDSIVRACARARPSVIVNCVGIVKQLEESRQPLPSLLVNAAFPHRLAALGEATGARVIHISTDCVFSGRRGRYSEGDTPDADDLYGRTKLLGEVSGPGALTLRTSIIGRELAGTTGLAEWFLAHRGGLVRGYTRAVFSGVTTAILAALLADIVERHPTLQGVYHVASEPITKYDLLRKLNEAYAAAVEIEPSEEVRIDRSLDGSRFLDATGLAIPSWDEMSVEMAADPSPYEEWRHAGV